MTDGTLLWDTLREYLPRRRWTSLSEVLAIVEGHVRLDAEDLARTSGRSEKPMWKTNVRRLLRAKVRAGVVRSRKDPRPPGNSSS